MLAASGAAAVMIGRGAIGAPWRVGAISRALSFGGPLEQLPASERRDDALEHLDSLLSAMGERAGLRHARKHLAAYAEVEGAPARLRRELVTTDNPERAKTLIADAFDDELRRAA